jgi:hypothetical protein
VGLVLRGPQRKQELAESPSVEAKEPVHESPVEKEEKDEAPRTGVEVVEVEERNGSKYYTMRDLRNGNVVKNVTRTSARRLWHYAITEFAKLPTDISQTIIQWQGHFGLLSRNKHGKLFRYDLVQRTNTGNRFYFGVTDDGIHGPWKNLVGQEDD